MKRLFLLVGLLLAFAAPNFAQTKTDTIRLNLKPITDDVSDWILYFSFPDSIKAGIEIEWKTYNETNSQRLKPGENGFRLNEDEGYYPYAIQDSGQLRIYYTYKQSSSYGFALGTLISGNTTPFISVAYRSFEDSFEISSTSLTALYCDTQLTSLDVSKLTALTKLYCKGNLTTLDVSHNTALTELYCYDNQLTSLDVSHNTALTYLDCSDNQLTTLDVSHNTALTVLYCHDNQLTSLDVNNTALTELYCNDNQLTDLDVSQNTALVMLDCSYNQLTSLDVSHNTALTRLWCHGNQLTSLDVSHNTALTRLTCEGNQLTTLDVSHNTALTRLTCEGNQLTTLDVSHNTALTRLTCEGNQLTTLDVSHNTALTRLTCEDNQLKNINLGNNTQVNYLKCYNNHIPLNMLYKAYTQENDWLVFEADPQTDTIFIQSQQVLDLSSERLSGENVSTFKITNAFGQTLSSDAWTEKDFTFRFHKNGLYKLTLQNNIPLRATFTWYVSVVDKIPEGYFTVLVAPDNAEGGAVAGHGTYQKGKNATITAIPNKDYRFVNWAKKDGTVFSTDSVHTFAVMENLELTANFEKLPDDVANEAYETDRLRVYAQGRTIYLSENRGAVQVYNVAGQCVYSGSATVIPVRQSGVYIVRAGKRSHKVIVP